MAGLGCGSGGAAVLHSAVRQRVGGDGAEAANSSNTEVETCTRRWREVRMVKARRPRMGSGGRVWVAVAMRPWAVTVNRWRGLVAAQGRAGCRGRSGCMSYSGAAACGRMGCGDSEAQVLSSLQGVGGFGEGRPGGESRWRDTVVLLQLVVCRRWSNLTRCKSFLVSLSSPCATITLSSALPWPTELGRLGSGRKAGQRRLRTPLPLWRHRPCPIC